MRSAPAWRKRSAGDVRHTFLTPLQKLVVFAKEQMLLKSRYSEIFYNTRIFSKFYISIGYKRIILRGLELSGVEVTSILGPAALRSTSFVR
jgi:hypothetical protein